MISTYKNVDIIVQGPALQCEHLLDAKVCTFKESVHKNHFSKCLKTMWIIDVWTWHVFIFFKRVSIEIRVYNTAIRNMKTNMNEHYCQYGWKSPVAQFLSDHVLAVADPLPQKEFDACSSPVPLLGYRSQRWAQSPLKTLRPALWVASRAQYNYTRATAHQLELHNVHLQHTFLCWSTISLPRRQWYYQITHCRAALFMAGITLKKTNDMTSTAQLSGALCRKIWFPIGVRHANKPKFILVCALD